MGVSKVAHFCFFLMSPLYSCPGKWARMEKCCATLEPPLITGRV